MPGTNGPAAPVFDEPSTEGSTIDETIMTKPEYRAAHGNARGYDAYVAQREAEIAEAKAAAAEAAKNKTTEAPTTEETKKTEDKGTGTTSGSETTTTIPAPTSKVAYLDINAKTHGNSHPSSSDGTLYSEYKNILDDPYYKGEFEGYVYYGGSYYTKEQFDDSGNWAHGNFKPKDIKGTKVPGNGWAHGKNGGEYLKGYYPPNFPGSNPNDPMVEVDNTMGVNSQVKAYGKAKIHRPGVIGVIYNKKLGTMNLYWVTPEGAALINPDEYGSTDQVNTEVKTDQKQP